jgi:hypothetical protein
VKGERGITGDNGDPPSHILQNVGEILEEPPNDYDLHNAEKALPARVRKSIEEKRSALA